MDPVSFHHFALAFPPSELAGRLAEVRFVLVAGSAGRAKEQALYLAAELGGGELELLTKPDKGRFCLFKVGPALVADHGMGSPSLSICLHELLLMCRLAGRLNHQLTVIRFGTCGGIGVEPGTVCITNRALDPLFQDFVELKICGKLVRRPAAVDQRTCRLIMELAEAAKQAGKAPIEDLEEPYETRLGATVATNDFYEEQARTNGAICEHSHEDQVRYLRECRQRGVINFEMESNHLAAICHKLGLAFAVVCVALNNRLQSGNVLVDAHQLARFERRLFWHNLLLIRHKMSSPSELMGANGLAKAGGASGGAKVSDAAAGSLGEPVLADN